MKSKILIALSLHLGLLISLAVTASPAFACSCALPGPSPQDYLQGPTAIFAGKVIKIEKPTGSTSSTADLINVMFETSRWWKGPGTKTFTIFTAREGASCGYPFKEGEKYLVYSSKEKESGRWETGLCDSNKVLAEADSDLKELGTGQTPQDQVSVDQPTLKSILLFTSGVLAGAILLTLLNKFTKRQL